MYCEVNGCRIEINEASTQFIHLYFSQIHFHISFQQLVAQLRSDEELRAQAMAQEMCHCGIRVCDSELPEGWSVHRSQEAETRGRLFFVSGKSKIPNFNTL